jgi:hypothetical protein
MFTRRIQCWTLPRVVPFLMLITGTASAQTPTLVQSRVWVGNAARETGNNFLAHLNKPAGTGNLLVFFINSPGGASSPTVTDNAGNIWTNASVAGCVTTTLSTQRKHQLFYSLNTAGGTQDITIAFSSAQFDINFGVAEFYNVATSNAVDGSVCAVQKRGPSVSSGSLTTAADGDLIVNFVDDEADGHYDDNNSISAIALCDICTGLYADHRWGLVGQFAVQPAHGPIAMASTWTQGTNDQFGSLAVAFKKASAGTAPAPGIRIIRSYVLELRANAERFSFPCSGNLIVAESPEGPGTGNTVSSITSTPSLTWSRINPGGGGNLNPQLFHVDNVTTCPAPPGMLTGTINSSAPGFTTLVYFWDIAGAATSPLDIGVSCPSPSTNGGAGSGSCFNLGSQSNAGADVTNAPNITPSTANGLVISAINFGLGPIRNITGAGFVYDGISYTNESDASYFANGDGASHIFNSGTAALTFHYTMQNVSPSSWQGMATAFKAAPGGTQPPAAPTGLTIRSSP